VSPMARGLRVSEVASLKVSDIDSKRMMLRIEQGKGRKSGIEHLRPYVFKKLMLCRVAEGH
jgi:integrase/recombinase XerD